MLLDFDLELLMLALWFLAEIYLPPDCDTELDFGGHN